MAANLGAKLVGPLILKSFEKLFDGPIKVIQNSFGIDQSPVTWLDIVSFARTNPGEFILTEHNAGARTCRFWFRGGEVEVSEDDFRLITSGVPERMIPTQALPDDETSELATLNILEARLAMLIKKADAVASKARQLNYHLKGRKTALKGRKAADQPSGVGTDGRTFSPQPFSAVNRSQPNGEAAKLQAELLDQFIALERQASLPQYHHKPGRISNADSPQVHLKRESDARRLSNTPTAPIDDSTESHYRALMAAKIENLNRGDRIFPPCDRCRRLGYSCTKHLTACQPCTKKHAKCSWKDIKEGELDDVSQTSGTPRQSSFNGLGQVSFAAPSHPSSLMTPRTHTTTMASNDRISPNLFLQQAPAAEDGQESLLVNAEGRMVNDSKISQEHSELAEVAAAASRVSN